MSTVMTRSEKQKMMDDYLASHDPYQKPASLGISIRKVMEYAKKIGKPVSLLTEEEVMAFKLE